ncbi:hypothetical protein ACWCTA_39475, partial [Streptomyces sp. NPDC001704]
IHPHTQRTQNINIHAVIPSPCVRLEATVSIRGLRADRVSDEHVTQTGWSVRQYQTILAVFTECHADLKRP